MSLSEKGYRLSDAGGDFKQGCRDIEAFIKKHLHIYLELPVKQ